MPRNFQNGMSHLASLFAIDISPGRHNLSSTGYPQFSHTALKTLSFGDFCSWVLGERVMMTALSS